MPAWFICPGCAATLEPAARPGGDVAGLRCVTAFEPNPVIFDLVHALKYESQVALVDWFAGFVAGCVSDERDVVLIPVPLHSSRERARGFNQSALLARAVAARLEGSVAEQVLVRTRPTAPQARLAHADRARNVAGAFERVGRVPERGRLLLVDDVVTTGATVAAALEALGTGAERTWVVALCRAHDVPAGESGGAISAQRPNP